MYRYFELLLNPSRITCSFEGKVVNSDGKVVYGKIDL